MTTDIRVPSIEAAADSIGGLAARQMDLLWREAMSGQGGVSGPNWFRLISGEAHPLGNVAIVLSPDDVQVTALAADPLLTFDLPSAVLYPDGVSNAVVESLHGKGFLAHGAMPAMAVDIDALPTTTLPPGYLLQRIGTDAAASAWTDALAAGYDLPRGLARMLSPEAMGADMAVDAPVQFFAVRHQQRIVATSMLFLAGGVAGIYCVATLPQARKQGLAACLTAAPLRLARDLGYGVGVLQSSEAGYGVYRALGFRDVASIPLFLRFPGS